MKEKIKLFLAFFVCFLLQTTLLNHFDIFGVTPNLILIMTVVFSFFFENYNGIVLGTIFGLLQDICFGQVIGISALIYFCMGITLQFIRVSVYRDNKLILLALTIFCTVAYTGAYWALSSIMLQFSFNIINTLKFLPVAIVWNYIFLLIIVHFAKKLREYKV